MPGAFKSVIKTTANTVLPQPVLNAITRYRQRDSVKNWVKTFSAGRSTQEIFTKIYTEQAWGRSGEPSEHFFSGEGSHDPAVVQPYVDALAGFLETLDHKLDAVDLGCGDFSVGSQLRQLCRGYIACDIVPPLIDFNRKKFAPLQVDFRVLDLSTDPLPEGEIIFIRQVLQHLSNRQIKRLIPKISGRYRYVVVTEHLPATPSFIPNLDFPTGPLFRPEIGSGIVLTAQPFNLKVRSERILCELPQMGGRIRTVLYAL